MTAKVEWRRQGILVLDDVFDDGELAILSSIASTSLFEEQELGRGLTPARSRQRAQAESQEVANILWWHLAEHVSPLARWFDGRHHGIRLHPEIDRWVPSECNSRSRLYRYRIGADFREHEDEAWRPKRNVRSFLTVLVYLPTDEPCVGGETVIDGEVVAVKPGRIVVFPHDLLHEGRPVESGKKLVLRNDIIGVGVSGQSLDEWRAADLSAPQLAAVADAAGWRDVEVVKLLIAEFADLSLGEANSILLRLRGNGYRAERSAIMTSFAYGMSLPETVTDTELEKFEARTQFGRKLKALTDAGRHGDVDAALDRLLPDELGVRVLTVDEARRLVELEISDWGMEMVLLDQHTTEYDFGWAFTAQSQAFVDSGNALDMAVGHGPVVVDRFTGAVWVTGSAQLDWLETYRITGDPTTTL